MLLPFTCVLEGVNFCAVGMSLVDLGSVFMLTYYRTTQMSEQSPVKTFRITGDAAESYASMGGRKRRSTRRTGANNAPVIQRGGVGVSAGWAAGARAPVLPTTPSLPVPAPAPAAPVAAPPPAVVTQPSVPATSTGLGSQQKGGAAEHPSNSTPKVILAPKKVKSSHKVLLAPKGSSTQKKSHVHKTRKIRVGLSGMRRRITRAKKITEDSEKKEVNEIRSALVEAKLIKDGSKVPESLMRSMYKDYLLLKDRAL